ncbi:anhydro-N-acetylmuramic acid kinase [bacterium]|nr:anhydro-N-acetylmuramic acid kinase [bacterium]
MSGTSMDGMDAVLFSYQSNEENSSPHLEIIASHQVPYSQAFRQRLLDCIDARNLEESCELSSYWAQLAIETIHDLLKKSKRRPHDVDVIASHGQTLLHHPSKLPHLNFGYTLQIGSPSFIAQHTGITCVGNFRQSDIAQGGQGAPLLPTGHAILFKPDSGYRSIHNLGGISNLTLLSNKGVIMAYDTGPANMWIDAACRHYSKNEYSYDPHGQLAQKGTVNPNMVKALLKHPYFKEKAPKSTGYETFGKHHLEAIFKKFNALSLEDALASVTDATAISIAQAYQKDIFPNFDPLHEIVFSGGGCYNFSLIKNIQRHLGKKVTLQSTQDYGCAPNLTEAVGFGVLAVEFLRGKPNIDQVVTGAQKNSIGGELAWGSDPKHIDRLKNKLLI